MSAEFCMFLLLPKETKFFKVTLTLLLPLFDMVSAYLFAQTTLKSQNRIKIQIKNAISTKCLPG